MAVKKKKPIRNITASSSRKTSVSHIEEDIEASSTPSGYSLRVSKKILALVIGFVILAGLVYYFRSLFIVATVNGTPISRIAFIKDLEKQYGKQTLNSLVTKNLILQEAEKKKITISDSELNSELKKIEESYTKQGQKLDQLLEQQGMKREDFKERIKVQKLIEKLLAKDISVTDKEVTQYMEKNKELFPEGTDMKAAKENITQQLKQQKLGEKFQTWIQNLEKNAKVNYFIKY